MSDLSAPARTLVLARLAVGVLSWLAPGLVARLFAVDPNANPNAPYIMRLFAIRDVALALGLLLSQGEARTLAVRLGLMCDVGDLAAAGVSVRGGSLSPVSGVLGGGAAAGGVALGVAALAAGDED